MKQKKTKKPLYRAIKEINHSDQSTNSRKVVWVFDKIDRSGAFCFDIKRADFEHKDFLDKLISFSSMTWSEVLAQKHDKAQKTKHHLLEFDSLSKPAKDRISALKLEQDTDRIFSFALTNTMRIIGLRDGEKFCVKWYDPKHQFCPSSKK